MPFQNIDIAAIKNRYNIVGNSPELELAIRTAVSVARTQVPVLIIGESGVGKDAFSRIIHDFSSRKGKKFLPVNCGAIPSGTVNSELFGHEKGSFTGAIEARKGYFEEANGGTIFLDEIGELPRDTQAQLLRVLQQGEFMRVGSSKIQRTDVRVIAATNLDLQHAISQNQFRLDLYYRLNTITLHIPPLRERPDDIPLLFKKFCLDFATQQGFAVIQPTHDAEKMLKAYRWPGNVRELMSIANRVCTMESQEIKPSDRDKRTMLTSLQLAKYMPHDEYSNVPALFNTQDSGINEEDKAKIIRSILSLKQEIEQLKEALRETQREQHFALSGHKNTNQATLTEHKNIGLVEDLEQEPEEQLQEDAFADDNEPATQNTLADDVLKRILASLKKHNGNRRKVALELGISDRTIYRKIKKLKELGLWEGN